MASPKNTSETPKFILSPHQQDLLFAALNSNRAGPNSGSLHQEAAIPDTASMAFDNSPLDAPGSGTMPMHDSPFIDYDYEFDNAAGDFGDFDFATMPPGQMIGNLPGTSSDGGDAQSHDKRGLSEDDVEDDEHDGKRREGDEKGAKKPGRKPLTSEPTSKRKAQNRAAQRAFRERKEKHLKDLETKVQDLEKASESANHENLLLRAKVEKMAVELKEYKKRVNGSGKSGAPTMPAYLREASGNIVNNPQDVNFSFEFPKFGKLPGPAVHPSKSDSHLSRAKSATSPGPEPSRSTSFTSTVSPHNSLSFGANQSMPNLEHGSFSTIFGQHNSPDGQRQPQESTSRSSTDSSTANSSNGHNTSQNSPASSNSRGGPSSSCGTSPEPCTQSPPAAQTLDTTLTTIGEEEIKLCGDATQNTFCEKLSMVCGSPLNPVPRTMSAHQEPQEVSHSADTTNQSLAQPTNLDYNSLDWFAAQNNNAFDPQLFNDYREPQDSILGGGLYDDAFFNDAFALPADLGSPFNFDAGVVPSGVPQKKDLLTQIDEKLQEDDDDEVVPAESEMLTCTNMWDKIQACPRVQNGEIDMDQLCTELQHKAKCSGDGPVIQEKDFKEVLNSMFTAQGMAPCTD